jgi:hypothetical protein
LEGELIGLAGQDTSSTRAGSITGSTYAFTVRDNLIQATSVAVSVAVEKLIRLALTDTG